MKNRIIAFFIAFVALFVLTAAPVFAAEPTDEITDYEITVDINEDGTLNIYYHIDWLVLESDSLGPLTWVNVGIPNSHCVEYQPLSDTVSSMSISGSSAKIYLDDSYYEGETASFDFMIVQDNMYQVDKYEMGSTEFSFTPGWFDDIEVDRFVLRWDRENITGWSPEALDKDGYLTWERSFAPGETFTVGVTYPTDAYNFDMSKTFDDGDGGGSLFDGPMDAIYTIIGALFVIGIVIAVCVAIFKGLRSVARFVSGTGFRSSEPKKQITRTKIEYYTNCPNCGGPRSEGEKTCSYCGGSLVKSEEVITEADLRKDEKEARKYNTDGEYHYSSNPNVYVRVHTVFIPPSRPAGRSSSSTRSSSSSRSGFGGRSSGGSHHSSCAHSSCACACACACAGGGRAGCTNKDFYNTNLKLKQLELKAKKENK